MQNNIYINFSAENSSNDPWVSELLSSFGLMLGKVSNFLIQIKSGLERANETGEQLNKANLVILVFNGFVSDDFSRDLRVLELNHQELVKKGKEIFIVVKSPKFNSIIPVYLRKYLIYNFFEINIRTNETIEYISSGKGEKESKYWSKLTDLVYDTKLFFETLNNSNSPLTKKVKVYLAEVSKDQVNNREILKREFMLSGYEVIPAKPLPASLKEYREAVAEAIKPSRLSVHIMGEVYGDSPSGSDYSYPEIQNKLVSELLSQNSQLNEKFFRLVWLPPNLDPYDEKQIQYLKRLKRELNDSSSGEIIQCSIEEFKEIIVQKIAALNNENNIFSEQLPESKVVLLIDKPDEVVYQKVVGQIKKAGKNYELIDLTRTGELLPLTAFNQLLSSSEAAVIINMKSRKNWMSGILGLAIKNYYGTKKRHSKPIAALSNANNKEEIDFGALNVEYIELEDSQFTERLEKFLTQIQ